MLYRSHFYYKQLIEIRYEQFPELELCAVRFRSDIKVLLAFDPDTLLTRLLAEF